MSLDLDKNKQKRTPRKTLEQKAFTLLVLMVIFVLPLLSVYLIMSAART